MIVFDNIADTRQELERLRCAGKKIGFVPTMGALHQGHLQLLRMAAAQNDVVVCSIFVNPTQFNNPDDYRLYPRLLEQDMELLKTVQCNILFAPDAAAMYPQQSKIKISFGELESVMEGAHRPGHFSGVATVVSKLFHVVQPHRAYFGQKDLQQYAIIRQMVADLNIPVALVCHPIVREADGLAMSSRNRRLTPQQRELAPQLYQALLQGQELLPVQNPEAVKAAVAEHLKHFPDIELEYVEVADAQTLQPLMPGQAPQEAAICIAAFLGDVRLIDNVVVPVTE
ncbi:MAG: pantoate--beta-alanine ligase [Hymenobacteraceae bacterium]|nr:pantoate--beta-alanine ligase [Hymenobacteraceae bacterium]MDX5395063.1 pantoate--beta-alanine ligase [Hymenobacteraceae bacterium]MDX5444258.1 pantoate--beta-alanine ligase [Hymenobacteraceae bacterium]MDX5511099.1 pantoate--beta-alanine ligase [Hymenobacteraceae bacterium]